MPLDAKTATPGNSKEQRLLRSAMQTQLQVTTQANAKDEATDANKSGAEQSVAQIHVKLNKILAETGDLRRSLSSVDGNLKSLVSRITEVEDRVSRVEDEQASMKANPAATKVDVLNLQDKLAGLEDRSRRNNLRFVGIPEGSEKGDTVAFLNTLIATSLDLDPPVGGFEMDRAHRVGSLTAPGDYSRTIIVRFLRFKDRQEIMEVARSKKQIKWNGKQVMIFPDYSKETQRRREAFKGCKKALHERNIKFSLMYPARLKITTSGNNSKIFENPEHAMDYILERGGN